MALNVSQFSPQDGVILTQIASISEFGSGPVTIASLTKEQKALVTRLLGLPRKDLDANGLSVWGPEGTFGLNLEVNSMGYPIYQPNTVH